jgi:hypothetical protein
MLQLPVDCINDIFEFLEYDTVTLYSCLLVNRLWCNISVKIYWREIKNINGLIACFPDRSKKFLYNNGIPNLPSKPPIFNYVSFCKVLSNYNIHVIVERFLKKRKTTLIQDLRNSKIILLQEIYKFLMGHMSSLRTVTLADSLGSTLFTSFPGASDCLKNISGLYCYSDNHIEILRHLSRICYNIRSLKITFGSFISNGLGELILAQRNLKDLTIIMFQPDSRVPLTSLVTFVSIIPSNLITLSIHEAGATYNMPLSFIARLSKLQKLILTIFNNKFYGDFNELQYTVFPKLQVLEFNQECPRNELLINFLENNGKNLKEFYVKKNDNSLNLVIINCCPNLIKLSIRIKNEEIKILNLILKRCKHLEYIKIFCKQNIDGKKILKNINLKYPPKIIIART